MVPDRSLAALDCDLPDPFNGQLMVEHRQKVQVYGIESARMQPDGLCEVEPRQPTLQINLAEFPQQGFDPDLVRFYDRLRCILALDVHPTAPRFFDLRLSFDTDSSRVR